MDLPIEDNTACTHCDCKRTCVIIQGNHPYQDTYYLCMECLDVITSKLEKALEARLGYTPTSYDD